MSDSQKQKNNDQPPYGIGRNGYSRGYGRGYGRGRGGRGARRGRGRPPIAFPVDLQITHSKEEGELRLTSFESKLLQLSDLEELTQQEIADKLNISQTSVWRYLKSIRKEITRAILQNKVIKIKIED